MQDIVIIARGVGMGSTVMTRPLRVARQQIAPPTRYRKLVFRGEGAMGTEVRRIQGKIGAEAYSGCSNGRSGCG